MPRCNAAGRSGSRACRSSCRACCQAGDLSAVQPRLLPAVIYFLVQELSPGLLSLPMTFTEPEPGFPKVPFRQTGPLTGLPNLWRSASADISILLLFPGLTCMFFSGPWSPASLTSVLHGRPWHPWAGPVHIVCLRSGHSLRLVRRVSHFPGQEGH